MGDISQKDLDKYNRERQVLKQFNDWRAKVSQELPELSSRIFAIRNKQYMGCGFHWSLEKNLGGLINGVRDYDKRYDDPASRICLEILYADLCEQIDIIEFEIAFTK